MNFSLVFSFMFEYRDATMHWFRFYLFFIFLLFCCSFITGINSGGWRLEIPVIQQFPHSTFIHSLCQRVQFLHICLDRGLVFIHFIHVNFVHSSHFPRPKMCIEQAYHYMDVAVNFAVLDIFNFHWNSIYRHLIYIEICTMLQSAYVHSVSC